MTGVQTCALPIFTHNNAETCVAINAFKFPTDPSTGPAGTQGGSVKRRASLYVDVKLEMLDTDELLRINTCTASISGLVATLTVICDQSLATWPYTGSVPTDRKYALIPQMGQEHHELIGLDAALNLLRDTNNIKQTQLIESHAAPLRAAFESASSNRPQLKNRSVRMADWL